MSLNDPVYFSWHSAKRRCHDPRHKQFCDYGGRGIYMAPEWQTDWKVFAEYIGPRPKGGILDRINNDLGYFPGNVRWANSSTSNLNKRTPKNNSTGVKGVQRYKNGMLIARAAKREILYYGADFFSACCARKSWENQNVC